jgi:predicted PurR-regulated permease PerM
MHYTFKQLWQQPYFRLAIFLLMLAIVCWFFYQTRTPWIVFILAYTTAYLLNPVVSWLRHYRIPRWAGTLISLSILLGLVSLAVYVLIGFVEQATLFVQEHPDLGAQIAGWYETLPQLARRIVPAPILELLSQYGDRLETSFETSLGASAERLASLGSNVFSSVVGLIGGFVRLAVFLVLMGFFLNDFPSLNHHFFRIFPKRHHPAVIELVRKLDLSVGGYIRGQLLIALCVGFAIWLGMALLNVPFALGIAFLAGVFNIVPYLGPVVAFIPAALLALTLGWGHFIATAAIFLGVNFLDGNILSPFIFSYTIKLHPVAVLTAIIVGASLFGILGAVIAVPTVAFLSLLYEDYYLSSSWYDKE